ncbi:Na/Pi cotransporter family protein [Rhodohalobacter sp. SW132]|uniref:Na/Pi cotransporter family protein n=1 Tax=Rhodohalobacter sp. SW132 TaxID=2293433 RepID=UPI000E251D7F|nr:Na/Pi cotransporter family protein [Rhodohalobacter sp. SW132]REL24548.1 Na/Pi cotransporter family protein [Rhodohalobacter sp. SW132]
MNYTFFDFLQLVGSLGIFIYGMKIFSDGLQKVAGGKLRAILKGMTTTRLRGIITGFGATTVTQSSTTTTVMVVSFVNAGLITFIESTGVIMGANIGTTVTAWMVSIFGFKMQITPIAIAMIGIFFPFMFFGREKFRNLAEAMIGFGILFIGLEFIKNAVPNIDDNPEMFMFLDGFTEFGFLSILIFVLAGTVLTLLTQSSSAATAITLVMLFQGWIDFPIAAAMILGENIGTTVTANIAAIIGNVHAKRAARFHLIFNLFGVIWMLIVLQPFLVGIDNIMSFFAPEAGSVFEAADEIGRANATLALSLFHTTFNVLNVLILFAFVPRIISLVEKVQKESKTSDDKFRLQYISSGMMSSPEMSIEQARKEIELFAKLIDKMHFSFQGLFYKKQKKHEKFLKKIKKREQITDNIELEIAEYLTKISSFNLSDRATRQIRAMHSMINDLERVGDIYFQMSKTFEQMQNEDIKLPKDAAKEIGQMLDLLHNAIRHVRHNLDKTNGEFDLDKAIIIEKEINDMRDKLMDQHYKRLEENAYSNKAGFIYLDYLNRMEKIGDHLFNVSEALAGRKVKSAYSRVMEDRN